MRQNCISSLAQLARQDPRVVFIGSDTSKANLGEFIRDFPDRFFMEGVCEANIIGMAAGMAMSGKIPYINTIATFLTRRCYEQILIDLGLHNLPVRLLGSGGGVVYAPLGPTHLATDDIALMQLVPNMTVVSVCDAKEMDRLMPQTISWPGPMYIRIAKGSEKIVSDEKWSFEIGKGSLIREGRDILLMTTGVGCQIALETAEALAAQKISCEILHLATIKPLDVKSILCHAEGKKGIFTIEEHRLSGGLGSTVASLLLEEGWRGMNFRRFSLPDDFIEELGSQEEVMRHHGLDAKHISQAILKLMKESK